MNHDIYMSMALDLAREAAAEGEVPVGCVIVRGETVVGRGRNRRETEKNALAHAEIEAINDACRTLGGWRLWECTLYVTLEPCAMCAGAIISARIPRVVYGASDKKIRRGGVGLQPLFHGFQPSSPGGGGGHGGGKRRPDAGIFRNLRLELRTRPKWKPGNG